MATSFNARWTIRVYLLLLIVSVIGGGICAYIGDTTSVHAGDLVHAGEHRLPVTFTAGHETDPKDHGRPVALVAGALGVKPDVFRKAFSGVRPARGRGPTGEEARRNKEALMKVLGPYKVTNDRLDEVSDYYRYRPQDGELWPTRPAKAHAIVKDGRIERIVVTDAGAGYNSPPRAVVKGFEKVRLVVTIEFGKDVKKNGCVKDVAVAKKSVDSKKATTKGAEREEK
jgi:hypothetical protein